LIDAQEQESYRSTLRERRPSMKFLNFVALICSVINFETSNIQGETDQQGWRNANMYNDVCDIVLESETELVLGGSSGNSFLAKRECRC
jgi:hypothetical protein